MQERLQKIISAAGAASRRKAEELIVEGCVTVNGRIVRELGTKADPEKDAIKVSGKLIHLPQSKTYIVLNKPRGFITSMKDPEGRPVVTELLKGVKARVVPVGRLDYDTEGLLIMTNDGDLAHSLMHPSHVISKIYLAKVKGIIEDKAIERLEKGVKLREGVTAPARVKKLKKSVANSWVEITVHEGRYRQVRRMLEEVGYPVIKLIRVTYGSLALGNVPLGKYRHLTSDEVKLLKDESAGISKKVAVRR
ncbi:MAG: pseudouridine synthase [Nitrospirae bacterium RBG_16_43_11]|nr:MAG: pseudouridine synthase [Nitrospirae bacterium RBG_16_43_11]